MKAEMTGHRDLGFSRWHRALGGCPAIDVDLVGYCRNCDRSLYVIESTQAAGKKTATVAAAIARALDVPLFVVHYRNGPDGVADWVKAEGRVDPVTRRRSLVGINDDFARVLRGIQAEHAETCPEGWRNR